MLGLTLGSLFAASASTLASVFARTVVTPETRPEEDLRVLGYAPADGPGTKAHITLPATAETTVPGVYSFVFDGGLGHAQIGRIVEEKTEQAIVVREVEKEFTGELSQARLGRWTGFLWSHPELAGHDAQDVMIPVENGFAPAWKVDPPTSSRGGRNIWAIMVHGRGAKRTEGIRVIPTVQKLGMTSLLMTYRNDGEAPAALDGRYGLGLTEWKDIEAGIAYAINHGADEVVLFGWSMGGSVALQVADQSEYAGLISGLVLDGPVVDWVDVLAHQAKLNRIPGFVGRFGQIMLSSRYGQWLTGLAAPLDLRRMDWVTRSHQLKHPMLIIHSQDDGFVPIGPAERLAKKRPDLVSLIRFTQAQHTREWNKDPVKWDAAVTGWLHLLLNRDDASFGPRRAALTNHPDPA